MGPEEGNGDEAEARGPLSIVIIFTLGAITVRAMIYVHDEAGIGLFRRRGR